MVNFKVRLVKDIGVILNVVGDNPKAKFLEMSPHDSRASKDVAERTLATVAYGTKSVFDKR